MIFDGEKWVVPKYKMTRTVVTYDDRPELYPGATAEAITLTAVQRARLKEIQYSNISQADAIAYVFDGLGAPPDDRSDIDKLIDLIPADSMTDEVLDAVPDWQADTPYSKGIHVTFGGILYKVLQAHKSQSDWTPDLVPALFSPFLTSPTGPLDWVQPTSTNPYMKGDRVLFSGKTYESLIDANVWSPTAYPAGWKEIT